MKKIVPLIVFLIMFAIFPVYSAIVANRSDMVPDDETQVELRGRIIGVQNFILGLNDNISAECDLHFVTYFGNVRRYAGQMGLRSLSYKLSGTGRDVRRVCNKIEKAVGKWSSRDAWEEKAEEGYAEAKPSDPAVDLRCLFIGTHGLIYELDEEVAAESELYFTDYKGTIRRYDGQEGMDSLSLKLSGSERNVRLIYEKIRSFAGKWSSRDIWEEKSE